MARNKASARPGSRRRKSTPSKRGHTSLRHTASRVLAPLARWLWRTSKPGSARDGLTLFLVVLALLTPLAQTFSALVNARYPNPNVVWPILLVLLAIGSRTLPWWYEDMRNMTAPRARQYVSAGILVFVALSFSWHFVALSLGLDGTFVVLGPFSGTGGAMFVLSIACVLAFALFLDVPFLPFARAARQSAAAFKARVAKPEVVAVRRVDALPMALEQVPYEEGVGADDVISEPDEVVDVAPTQPLPAPASSGQVVLKPPLEIFAPPPKVQAKPPDLALKAQRIQETLSSFKVEARVVGHHFGPTVTQFDVQPERGVKVRRITELQNDLALALAAPTIRIQAPVPGKSVVGIEIPNAAATMVALRELLEDPAYLGMTSPLKVVLGKDVAGKPAVIDLAKMPHLLVAGATGSGKSVCINGLISCLLYQATPEDVRLLMIDPKMVELTVYNGVPHLLSPVVTEMDKVVGVLQWAIREMERRYQLFKDTGVRNISRFNEKALANNLKRLPYIVLIVDELADLMMVAPEDVEEAICRLAQLARAAGIHLVIATQRPSVDVVTGLIKANFPARIAFAMTSQVDSRTILDTVGAEKLLGRGDMLYMPPDAPKSVRLQGAFLSDQEIEDLVDFWKRSPLRQLSPQVAQEEFEAAQKAGHAADDDLLGEAMTVVREYQHVSMTLLQRRLRVGYARAARLMDQLEAKGVVGPADGTRQRPVLQTNGSLTDDGGPA